MVVGALLRWRLSGSQAAMRVDNHPARVAAAVLIAAAFGVAIDWSEYSQFPTVATACPSGALSMDPRLYEWFLAHGRGTGRTDER